MNREGKHLGASAAPILARNRDSLGDCLKVNGGPHDLPELMLSEALGDVKQAVDQLEHRRLVGEQNDPAEIPHLSDLSTRAGGYSNDSAVKGNRLTLAGAALTFPATPSTDSDRAAA